MCIRHMVFFATLLLLPTVSLADPATDLDTDTNGTVDFVDFVAFARAYGSGEARFDLDNTGTVDFADFVTFAQTFGKVSDFGTVTFADGKLEALVRDALDIPSGEFTAADARALTVLDASQKGITSLDGIQYLKGLRTLVIWGNPIADFSKIRELPDLSRLDVSRISTVDISTLAGATSIDSLTIGTNWENSKLIGDLTALGTLTGLEVLYMMRVGTPDFSPLANLSNLVSIHISSPMSDAEWISGLSNLNYVDITEAELTSLPDLSQLTQLRNLSLADNNITDISPLTSVPSLEFLSLSRNPITDFSPLASLPVLRSLDVAEVLTGDITALPPLSHLELLALGDAELSSLAGVERMVSLESLNVGLRGFSAGQLNEPSGRPRNTITDLSPLNALPSLRSLFLTGIPATDLSPLADCAMLEHLLLVVTDATDLSPLSSFPQLAILQLFGAGQVADIDAAGDMPALEQLSVNGFEAQSVLLSGNLPVLKRFEVSRNAALGSIPDFTHAPTLEEVVITGTNVTDISSLAAVANIKSLRIWASPVTDLTPLVNNPGLGSGDAISLAGVALSGTAISTQIPALEARGVTVQFRE